MYNKIPVFEVMKWPNSELEYWAAFFSIDANNDKPIDSKIKKRVTVDETIDHLDKVLR